jgi:hypothetical protein
MKWILLTGIACLGLGLASITLAPPAARLTDFHQAPMATPTAVPIPHVGGPIVGPEAPTILIGRLPAAKIGDLSIQIQTEKMNNLGPLHARGAVDILTNNQIGTVAANTSLAQPILPKSGLLLHPLIHAGAIPKTVILGPRLSDGGFHGQQIVNIHQTPFGPVAKPGLLQHP